MAIQTMTRYRTTDGTVFQDQQDALDHERAYQLQSALKDFIIAKWPADLGTKCSALEVGQMLLANVDGLKAVVDIKPTTGA